MILLYAITLIPIVISILIRKHYVYSFITSLVFLLTGICLVITNTSATILDKGFGEAIIGIFLIFGSVISILFNIFYYAKMKININKKELPKL